jgi:hypothetical protein
MALVAVMVQFGAAPSAMVPDAVNVTDVVQGPLLAL